MGRREHLALAIAGKMEQTTPRRLIEERIKGVDKLEEERKEMLKKLLGAEKDPTAEFNPSEQNREKLGFLPKEKQEQMLALTKKYNDERIKIQKETNGKPLTPEHGAPLRLNIPTKIGYKQAKYLTALHVTHVLDKVGYWEDQGYSWHAGL